MANSFGKIYRWLRAKYGKPAGQWRLWCRRPKTAREREAVVIGAILTQRTSWRNVEQAIANLKNAQADSLRAIRRLGRKDLEIYYQLLQKLFEGKLRSDYRLYQDFHAHIVHDGKQSLTKGL